jgi:NAD(P)-dependent dehydrogenase (short-subunit alcohol dehydrogenase family)
LRGHKITVNAVAPGPAGTELFLKGTSSKNWFGCSQPGLIGLGIFFFTRRRTVKTQQMTKYILGGVIAVGLIFFCASSNAQAKEKKMNEALTINGDGAQRNPDIHWPKGQHPENADLYAHNEIMLHASCETVFANIVDAQL